ncbi:MAG: type III secretion system inner membrane ring subunit SctD [Acetobacteraceae bacterium]|nr:type III secretion system inner membrane ring subunit SctD [Pseudomonadota bacterium]
MADQIVSAAEPNKAAEARPMLRVVLGANQGAEVPLSDGDWLIGTAADSDLTFAEPALADAHVRISVRGSACHIAALAAGVRLGADLLAPGDERSLPALQPVSIGATVFAIGPGAADWGDVGAAAAAAAMANATVLVPDAQIPEPVATPEAATADTVAPDLAAQGTPPPPAPGVVAVRWRPALLYGMIAGLACVGLLAASPLLRRPLPQQPPSADTDVAGKVRAVLDKLHLQDATVGTANGRVQISGHAETTEQIDALNVALRAIRIDADMQLVAASALTEMTGTVLRAFGIEASAYPDGPGRVRLTGYAASTTRLNDALQRLKADVAGLREINDRVVTPERAADTLKRNLANAGLADTIKVALSPRSIQVTGFVDQPRLARWSDIAEAFRKDYGDQVSLDTKLVTLTGAIPRGVRLGVDPFLMLADGSRLRLGDMLGTSGRIIAIQADRVRVRTESGDADLPFAQPPNWIVEDKP